MIIWHQGCQTCHSPHHCDNWQSDTRQATTKQQKKTPGWVYPRWIHFPCKSELPENGKFCCRRPRQNTIDPREPASFDKLASWLGLEVWFRRRDRSPNSLLGPGISSFATHFWADLRTSYSGSPFSDFRPLHLLWLDAKCSDLTSWKLWIHLWQAERKGYFNY